MRAGWLVLAVVTVVLALDAATSAMGQITTCETGLYSREVPSLEACTAAIGTYFGGALVPVLAVPVLVCLLPVFAPRPGVAWSAVAMLFVLSTVGIFGAVLSSKPAWVDLYGFFWPAALLAVLVTGIGRVTSTLRRDRTSRSARRGQGVPPYAHL